MPIPAICRERSTGCSQAAAAPDERRSGELLRRERADRAAAGRRRTAGRALSDALTLRYFSHVDDRAARDGRRMSGQRVYRIDHETRYVHDGGASTSQHVACLKPRTSPHQRVVVARPDDRPGARRDARADRLLRQPRQPVRDPRAVYRDARARAAARSNCRRRAARDGSCDEPSVGDGAGGAALPAAARRIQAASRVQLSVAVCARRRRSSTRSRAGSSRRAVRCSRPPIDLMHRIHDEFTLRPGRDVGRDAGDARCSPSAAASARISRTCSSRLLRSLGLPARYVSGYLLTDPPPGQPRLVGADASHAWVAVWCPVHGWVDLDPTNDVLPSIAPRHAGVGTRLRRRQPAARRGARRPGTPAERRGQRLSAVGVTARRTTASGVRACTISAEGARHPCNYQCAGTRRGSPARIK